VILLLKNLEFKQKNRMLFEMHYLKKKRKIRHT